MLLLPMVSNVCISKHPHSTHSAPETVLSASQKLIPQSRPQSQYYYCPYLQLGH